MFKSSALSLMAKANNNLCLPVIVVLIPFAYSEGKSILYLPFTYVFKAIYT